jgi:hypothetical protein
MGVLSNMSRKSKQAGIERSRRLSIDAAGGFAQIYLAACAALLMSDATACGFDTYTA